MTDRAKSGKVMADAAKFRAALATLEAEALRDIQELGGNIDSIVTARQDSNSDDEHDPEGTTLAYERSQSDALLRQAEQRLVDIRSARQRLDAGSFGVCVTCGAPIAKARLDARPYASTCITCAS